MKIVSWNVNGIRAVQKKGFFDWLEKESPDVLCLQETKISEDQLGDDLKNPSGYKTIWNSGERRGYSGVSVFYKEDPVSVNKKFQVKILNDEGRIIETEFGGFILFCVYFPNGQKDEDRLSYKLKFYESFLKYALKQKSEKKKEIVVVGDFNTAHTEIDLKNPKENQNYSGFMPIERKWIDKYIEAGFVDIFRKRHPSEEGHYTWWTYRFQARTRNVGWRIDYFMVTADFESSVVDCGILSDVHGSDHCPVYLTIK
jgi:exodeoxyribonuclease III